MSIALSALLELSLNTAFFAVSHRGMAVRVGDASRVVIIVVVVGIVVRFGDVVDGGGFLANFLRLIMRSCAIFCAWLERGGGEGEGCVGSVCGGGAEVVGVGCLLANLFLLIWRSFAIFCARLRQVVGGGGVGGGVAVGVVGEGGGSSGVAGGEIGDGGVVYIDVVENVDVERGVSVGDVHQQL